MLALREPHVEEAGHQGGCCHGYVEDPLVELNLGGISSVLEVNLSCLGADSRRWSDLMSLLHSRFSRPAAVVAFKPIGPK